MSSAGPGTKSPRFRLPSNQQPTAHLGTPSAPAALTNLTTPYVLAQILHDWDDEQNLAILSHCHAAMPQHARLLVVELVLPETDDPSFGNRLSEAIR
jgi:hypothetical protein